MSDAKRKTHPAFAKRLNEGMAREGITPRDIQAETGQDAETVRLWRVGKRMPREANLKKLAKMLGMPPGMLQHGDGAAGFAATINPAMSVRDEDERALLDAYRKLPPWAKKSVRARTAQLLEDFTKASTENPYGKGEEP